ncbi:hypothetical protein CDL15_Pgr001596 [Punica granatum]|uniref:Uncharacterized protein n=1 Tax=Punica granatum TaxID=22663 RepID=A0A218XCC8_PUNGR|nr:hypothetical protein CDL15_Pgr001596 [Punica granatum]
MKAKGTLFTLESKAMSIIRAERAIPRICLANEMVARMKRMHNLLCQLGTRWVEQEKAVRATVKITRYPFVANITARKKLSFSMKSCQLVGVGKMMDLISPIVCATTLIMISRRRMHNGNNTFHIEKEITFITVVCKRRLILAYIASHLISYSYSRSASKVSGCCGWKG